MAVDRPIPSDRDAALARALPSAVEEKAGLVGALAPDAEIERLIDAGTDHPDAQPLAPRAPHPCDDGCQHAKDTGTWPDYPCDGPCAYDDCGPWNSADLELDAGSELVSARAVAFGGFNRDLGLVSAVPSTVVDAFRQRGAYCVNPEVRQSFVTACCEAWLGGKQSRAEPIDLMTEIIGAAWMVTEAMGGNEADTVPVPKAAMVELLRSLKEWEGSGRAVSATSTDRDSALASGAQAGAAGDRPGAAPAGGGLPGVEAIERLLSVRSLQGPMAYFAVVQHPFNHPSCLVDVVTAIADQAVVDFDGPDVHRTKWFASDAEIERWLRSTLETRVQNILTAWNTPREGDAGAFAFVSRYGGPPPERDFIDIDALLRNVAMMAWREAAEYQREVRIAR